MADHIFTPAPVRLRRTVQGFSAPGSGSVRDHEPKPVERFTFRSTWRLPADVVTVWDHIARVTRYPTWWPGIAHVTLLRGPELPVRLGTRARYTVHAPLYALHYETEVVEVSPGHTVLATSTGDLVGSGRWTFVAKPDHTEAIFDWQVALTPALLRFVSRLPLAQAVMGYFHHRVMARGEAGLCALLAHQGVAPQTARATASVEGN